MPSTVNSEFLRDGNAPAHAERTRRHSQSGRGLAAFVFAERDLVDYVVYDLGGETAFYDFFPARIFDNVSLENCIKDFIIGQ